MAGDPTGGEIHDRLAALFGAGATGQMTDAQLLGRFLGGRPGDAESAIAALVDRHGPMVLRVCRRVMGDPHDAQDAFQATFLVLVRRAPSIHSRDSLASWLHGVALRVSRRARADASRRRLLETHHRPPDTPDEPDPDAWADLHDELRRLPARYRDPVVLCYLEGLTTEAAADRLGCPRGTVLSRLSRGRDRLRAGLVRRGHADRAGAIILALSGAPAPSAVPASLAASTSRIAALFATTGLTASAAGAAAASLASGVLRAMLLNRWITAVFSLLLVSSAGLAAGRLMTPAPASPPPPLLPAPPLPADPAPPQAVQNGTSTALPRTSPGSQFRGAGRRIVLRNDSVLVLQPEDRTRCTVYTVSDAQSSTYVMPTGTTGQPIWMSGQGVIALQHEGDSITQLAAYSIAQTGKWHTQDLAEPARGPVTPLITEYFAAYTIGPRVYAFSALKGTWDVLELTEGSSPHEMFHTNYLLVENGPKLFIFDVETARWNEVPTGDTP